MAISFLILSPKVTNILVVPDTLEVFTSAYVKASTACRISWSEYRCSSGALGFNGRYVFSLRRALLVLSVRPSNNNVDCVALLKARESHLGS
jgi:hypothetical protein